MNDPRAQADWAYTVISALTRAGVSRAVVSPGSRSTPLVWALAQSPMTLLPVIDERVAGFVALGASRADGRPTLLVCTSGTAAAHYYPAVIEAQQTGVPLLICTADRPPELQGNGSSQTIDQTRLFGEYACFFELGRPSADPAALAGAGRLARQAVAATQTGPAHLNAPFYKPLEPPHDWRPPASAPPTESPSRRARAIDVDEAASWLAPLLSCRRLAMVAGPQRSGVLRYAALAREVADALGAVLLAESASQWGAGTAAAGIAAVDDFVAQPERHPDGVLQLGPAPVSGGWTQWMNASRAPHVVICERGYADATNTASLVQSGDEVGDVLTALLTAARRDTTTNVLASRAPFRDSAAAWAGSTPARQSAEAIPSVRATARLISGIPPQAQLVVGNSLVVRDLDAASPLAAHAGPVLSQRGAAGIDGLVSGALGTAWATGEPTCVLLGDVSAAHDLSGFATLAQSPHPVVVIVMDNGGGRIFERLPVARNPHTAPLLEQHWLTPVSWSLPDVARALGFVVASARADAPDLADVVRQAFASSRATLIHVRVDPTADRAARDARRR